MTHVVIRDIVPRTQFSEISLLFATFLNLSISVNYSDYEGNAEFAAMVQQKLDAYKADEPTMGEVRKYPPYDEFSR